jgi:hypothetical protein
MGSRKIVIRHISKQKLAQVPLAVDDDMVKAFPAERANQPFRMQAQSAGPACPWSEAT